MTTRIPDYLKNILSTGEGSDFSIVVFDEEGNRTEKKVHKVVIRQCPYFSAMLDLKGTEANCGSATIENITNDIFEYVLRYIYTDEIDDMTMEQAVKVAVAADYLQLEDLKATSLKLWRDSLMKINTPEDVLKAFRTLVASPLRIKLDDSWRKVLESLLIAMHTASNFNIAEESDSFVEFFIDFFGTSHPCLSAHTLAKWATASNLDLTSEQYSERKKRTEVLLQKIELAPLSLQTLAILSRTEAFPAIYMLKQIQRRAEKGDSPVSGHVVYGLSFRFGRIVELEFESSYVLFRLMDVDVSEDSANKKIALWEFLHMPNDCKTKVALANPTYTNMNWPESIKRGDFSSPLRLEDFKQESGDFFFSSYFESWSDNYNRLRIHSLHSKDLVIGLLRSYIILFRVRPHRVNSGRVIWKTVAMGLPEYLKKMLNAGDGCDFSIIFFDAEGNKVEKRVHKMFLRRSPYFEAMLDLQGTEVKNGSVTMDIIPKETFDFVLHYLYTDQLLGDITMQQAIDIAIAGNYLLLTEMKELAVDRWRHLCSLISDNKEIISVLQSFTAVPLNVKPAPIWRRVAELLIIAIHDPEIKFDMETQPNCFVEFMVRLCGRHFPYYTVDLLCDWVFAKNNVTEAEKNERKTLALQLGEYISLHQLSLRTLVLIASRQVFSAEYLLKAMMRAEKGRPLCEKIRYQIFIRKSHVLELEYDLNYMLLNVNVDSEGKVTWSFLRSPQKCNFTVKMSYYKKPNEVSGTHICHDFQKNGLSFCVSLKPNSETSQIDSVYWLRP